MKALMVIFGLVFFVGAVVFFYIDATSKSWDPKGSSFFEGQGMTDGEPPVVTDAKNLMTVRYHAEGTNRKWASVVRWCGLGLTGLVLGISAWVTRPKKKDDKTPPTDTSHEIPMDGRAITDAVERALGESQHHSRLLVRVVAVLIALNSFSTLVSQRLDSEADRTHLAAKELDDGILETIGVIYNPKSEVAIIEVQKQKLASLMARTW